jgi:hypothetical protein
MVEQESQKLQILPASQLYASSLGLRGKLAAPMKEELVILATTG